MLPRRTLSALALAIAAVCAAPAVWAKPPPPVINIAPPPLELKPIAPAAISSQTVPRIFLSPDGETAYIIGPILDDAFLRFDALMQHAPRAKRVYLGSTGGLTLEGRLIAALVRKRHLDTYVEHYCASACTQVFVSGRERVLGPEAQLGFHQAVGVDETGETSALLPATTRHLSPLTVFGISGNDILRLAYERAGIDDLFIAKALAKRHEDIWLPTTAELLAAHAISRRAAKPEVAAPVGSFSVSQIIEQVQGRALWNAAKAAFPATYDKALQDAWRRANTGSTLDAAIASGRGAIVVAAWPRLAAASDAVLDRMLSLYAQSARAQRAQGYPMCKETLESEIKPQLKPIDKSFEASEDALLVELLGAPAAGPAMSEADAHRIFARDIAPAATKSFEATDIKSTSSSCRLGFWLFETIDSLPAKKRVTAYRALLTLPDPDG